MRKGGKMVEKTESEIFPNLNSTVLKVHAENWAKEFPLIKEIRLYRKGAESFAIYTYPKSKEQKLEYIFIVVHPHPPGEFKKEIKAEIKKELKKKLIEQVSLEIDEQLPSNDALLLSNIKYYEWKSSSCLHIRDKLIEFYKDQPDNIDYDDDWMWFTIAPGESIPSGMVNENYFWILYKDEKMDFELFSENFLINAREEIERIYSELKKSPGINDRNLPNGDTLRHKAAINYFKKNKSNFKILKEKYLNKVDTYKIGSRPRREIIGRILLEIARDKGLRPQGAQELFNTSQKFFKRLTNQNKK
jgi:hypothetical protein